MGVYINMEMPKTCYDCPLQDDECFGSIKCSYAKTWGSANMRAVDCPLIEVSMPHGKLIDAAQFECITYTGTEGMEDTFDAGVQWMLEKLDEAPTIIPAEEEI